MTHTTKKARNDSVDRFITELQWHDDYHKEKKDDDNCFFCKNSTKFTCDNLMNTFSQDT